MILSIKLRYFILIIGFVSGLFFNYISYTLTGFITGYNIYNLFCITNINYSKFAEHSHMFVYSFLFGYLFQQVNVTLLIISILAGSGLKLYKPISSKIDELGEKVNKKYDIINKINKIEITSNNEIRANIEDLTKYVNTIEEAISNKENNDPDNKDKVTIQCALLEVKKKNRFYTRNI